MKRRTFLAGSAVLATPLAMPSIGRAAGTGLLKFVPQSDVTVLDPIWTTAYVTRNHGYMIFDTLFGIDDAISGAARRWPPARPSRTTASWDADPARRAEISRRNAGAGAGLRRLDPALGANATPSARRLMAATDELSAADDKTIRVPPEAARSPCCPTRSASRHQLLPR